MNFAWAYKPLKAGRPWTARNVSGGEPGGTGFSKLKDRKSETLSQQHGRGQSLTVSLLYIQVISRHPRRLLSGIQCSLRKAWIPAQKRCGNDVLYDVVTIFSRRGGFYTRPKAQAPAAVIPKAGGDKRLD